MQRKANAGAGPAAMPSPPGAGSRLPDGTRAQMESSLGADFSGVRVHEGPQAEQVSALAYTQGQDIVFSPSAYQPESQAGRELLGHELTHVVQQSSGRVADPNAAESVINDDPALEAEADAGGARAARGESFQVEGATGATELKADGGATQRKVIQRFLGFGKKSKKVAGGFGKGLVNAVFPIFSMIDFHDNLAKTWKSDNPLYGKNTAMKVLSTFKEISQLVAALATMAATIFGIASVFAPPVAGIASVCGLVATIAHAVTFVLRGITIGFLSHRIKKLRASGDIVGRREVEKARWAEVGGMVSNGIGVIFGGIGGAFAASPKVGGDALIGGTNVIGDATSKMSSSGANALATGFGQSGNSLADIGSVFTEEMGGEHVDKDPEYNEKITITPEQWAELEIDVYRAMGMYEDDAEHYIVLPSDTVTDDAFTELSGHADDVVSKGSELNDKVETVNSTDVDSLLEGGNPDAIDESQVKQVEDLSDVVPEVSKEDDEVEDEDSGGSEKEKSPPVKVPDKEEDSSPKVVTIHIDEEDDDDDEDNAPQVVTVHRQQDEDEEDVPTTSRPRLVRSQSAPVLRKAKSSAPVQRWPSRSKKSEKPKKKRGSWFRRKIVNRLKKAVRKAKQKLMQKVTKLLGLDKTALAAKADLERVKSGNAPALTAEQEAAEAAKNVKKIVAEGRDKLGSVK